MSFKVRSKSLFAKLKFFESMQLRKYSVLIKHTELTNINGINFQKTRCYMVIKNFMYFSLFSSQIPQNNIEFPISFTIRPSVTIGVYVSRYKPTSSLPVAKCGRPRPPTPYFRSSSLIYKPAANYSLSLYSSLLSRYKHHQNQK